MRMWYFFCYVFGFFVTLQKLYGVPVVTSVSPTNGDISGGNVITISGSGFIGTSNVNFGLRPATTFVVNNDMSISATVPVGTEGTVDVSVEVASQTSSLSPDDFYTYTTVGWQGIISGTTPDEVGLFSTATNAFNEIIPIPATSLASIITPDATRIYTANSVPPGLSVIDAATNTIVGTIPTSVGTGAFDIIVNPAGTRLYMSNNTSGYVTVVDIVTNTVVTDIFVAGNLGSLSITPDGSTVYVGNFTLGTITAIDTASNTVGTSIFTGFSPGMISITPDGTKAFVTNLFVDTVSVIDLASQLVVNTINFPAGSGPYGSSILPDGSKMYVVSINDDTVTEVDVASEMIVGTIPLTPGSRPFWIASTPDGKTLYVVDETNDDVTPIDVATSTPGASFGDLGGHIQDLVMSPDPAPVAAFSWSFPLTAAVPISFDASASLSPIGTIVSYAWDFGDGTMVTTASPFVNHTYLAPGVFNVTLTVTNSAGTSTTKVFSSRFMSNNGGPSAVRMKSLEVLPDSPNDLKGVQIRCRYPSQTDIVNVLRWKSPLGNWIPAVYQIFRDASLTDLIGIVPGGSGPFKFFDHNRQKNKSYTYYVVAVSSSGARSAPAVVTIEPKHQGE